MQNSKNNKLHNFTKIEFFEKISDYFATLSSKNDSLLCPKHRIEHTGKNAYSIIINSRLHKLTGEEKYYERARVRIRKTIEEVGRDPEFGHWIFFPGRLGRWNMANSVIDTGICVDALSDFYLSYGSRLTREEKRKIEEAILKTSDSYLNKAVVVKEISNQRLWGGTGLARAYQIFKKKEWRKSLLDSIERSLKEMWPDGSFPYHSHWREYSIFKGIYDISTYYHSRCIGFIYYILENIGEDISKYEEKLIKSVDLLLAMYQPNGIKNINLESKRWYWNSPYEIASNSFDVYTLVKTYELTKKEIYAYYARKALNQILRHQLPDNGIDSHLNHSQNNFQCRVFWNAHLAWLLRIMDKLPLIFQNTDRVKESEYFEDSSIMKYKNENYSCILRGKKQAMNLMWGPAIGGGSLLYFGTRKKDWENILYLEPWKENVSGNFSFYIKENYFKNLKEFVIENKKEIRSKLYHALVELRAPNLKSFLTLLLILFKMIFSGSKGVYASQWAINSTVKRQENKIIFEVIPTKRNGKSLNGVKIKREYIFQDDGINIKENLFIENGKIQKIKYNKIPSSTDFKITTDLKCKEKHQNVLCYINKPKSYSEISYSLKNV